MRWHQNVGPWTERSDPEYPELMASRACLDCGKMVAHITQGLAGPSPTVWDGLNGTSIHVLPLDEAKAWCDIAIRHRQAEWDIHWIDAPCPDPNYTQPEVTHANR